MSSKPIRLREKGRQIRLPPADEPSSEPPGLQRQTDHPMLRQAVLCLCMLVLSALYITGLNHPATAVIARKRELPVYSVAREDQVLAISFDASWGADKTIPILDILDKYDVKTTFFLVGGWVDKYPEMLREIVNRGHEIGNHSDTHPHMSQLSEGDIRKELHNMSAKVENLTGVKPTLFRPPYGDYNDRVVTVSRAEGYECVQWSIDSLDWKDRGTADIIKQCTYRVEPGDIVLFHNDSNDIVNALPTVIEHYQQLGYTIIPVSQILLDGEYTIDVQGRQHPKATD